MKRRVFWLLTFIACAFVVWSALRTGGHDFTGDQCGDCHAFAPMKGDPRARAMKAPVSELCGGCHRRPKNSLSHPVEIAPVSVSMPSDFPLSWDGKLTCSTCHDVHSSPPAAWEGAWRYLRRPEGGREFCQACHRLGIAGEGGKTKHSGLPVEAHMEFDGKQKGPIDKISAVCLGCHDGSIGKYADVQIGSFRHGIRPTGSAQELSHPIGINYRKAMRRRGGLRPPESLDPNIKLINGRVGCPSCHDYYSQKPMLLTAPLNGARLCLSCHDK